MNKPIVMQAVCSILCLMMVAGQPTTQPVMNINQSVQKVIESYEPSWMPREGELRDIVVIIDPVGGGSADPNVRKTDDLALLTAGHLFHFVQKAGGIPIMTRADDRPMIGADASRNAALQIICAQCRGDLVVTIDFTKPMVAALGDDPLSRILSHTLAEAMEEKSIAEETGPSAGAPGAVAGFAALSDGTPESQRKVYHRTCAEKLYRAIAKFVDKNRKGVTASRRERFADLPMKRIHAVPDFPDRTWDEELQQAARRIWPDGDLPNEKAKWFCKMYCRTALTDRSIVFFEPEVKVEGDTVVVGGATNIAIMRETMARALKAVGIKDIRNEMKLLPEEGSVKENRFGVCIVPTALTFGDPREDASLQSQLLYGEPLLLLDKAHGYYLLQGGDGYYGWVRQENVRAMGAEEFKKYTSAEQATLLKDVDECDRRIVRGSTLPVKKKFHGRVLLALPEGGTLEIIETDVHIPDNSKIVKKRLDYALTFLYTPYVFGAVSPLGLDCSGLTRNVCEQVGIPVARDAAQQLLHGKLVGTRWYRDNIQPGDLLFFINSAGKVFHVGTALTPTHFIHSAPPEVKINSLKVGDRLYSEYRDSAFFAAKRP